MGRSAFEPHIHDVHHLFVVSRVAARAQEAFRGGGIPGICAFGAERVGDARDDIRITQRLAGGAVNEHRDRHAPGALAADAPVRPCRDHAVQPITALRRHETGGVDRLQRLGADGGVPVHADEPLRRGTEDQRSLGPPGMRIGMHQLAPRQQTTGLRQRRADRVGDLVDMLPGEMRHPGVEGAIRPDRVRHLQPMHAAEREILLAMAGGDMHEAGAGIGGDIVGSIDRHIMIIAPAAHRVGADSTNQIGALEHMHHMMRRDAGILADLRQQRQRDQDHFTRPCQAAFRHAVHADQGVVDAGTAGDGAVAGHGPGRRGPDDDGSIRDGGKLAAHNREAHRDGLAGMVVVFDLGFRQSGLFHRGPHDRAQAAIQRAVQ